MKKIEKLEIPDTNAVIGLADRDGKEIEIKAIGRKINEIIDYLNQSQKQPEGDYVNTEPEKVIVDPIGVDFTTEGKNREFPVEYKTREEIDKMFKPEKQDEWKERLAKYLKGTEYALWYGNEWDLSDEVEEFISQLLSERTFSKEELRLLNAYLSLALPEYNNFDKETKMHEDMDKLHKILEKVSKLSKEEE